MKRNAYQILGLEPTASQDEIKEKYEKVVHALNSTKGGPNPKLMAAVVEAGAVLGNPQTREQYDLQLARQLIPSAGSTRRRKILAASIAGGVALIACIGAGGWYAWDRGIIPGNPRALRLATVEPVARRIAAATIARRPVICASPELGTPAPEARGLPEVESGLAPGLFTVTLAKDYYSTQQARDRQIKQMEFLTKQGYFSARDVPVQTPAGEKPAREYRLSWEGFAQLAPGGSDLRPCFFGGQHAFVAVTTIVKEETQVDGFEVYNVGVTTKIIDAPKWASGDDAKEVFPSYAEGLKPVMKDVRLARSKEGWMSAQEVVMQINLAQSGQGQMMAQYMRSLASSMPPPLSVATARDLVNEHLKSEAGLRRMDSICIALNLSGAGDDVEAPKRGVRNIFTYQDKADRQPYSLKDLARRIAILETLAASGLAVRENGTGLMPIAGEPPAPAPAKAAKGARPPAVAAGPAWVRYRIDPGSIDLLGMGRYGGGCIPLGPAKTQYVGYVPTANMGGAVVLKATFEAAPELSKRIAERIPAVKVALTEGIALTASAQFDRPNPGTERAEVEPGQWKIGYVNPVIPQIKATEFPAQWLELMPLTAAIVARGSVPGMSGAYVPMPAARAPAVAPVPAPAPVPSPVPQKRVNAPPSSPAKSTLHVISIYEAATGGGKVPQGRREGIINVKVGGSDKPLWLVIDSYEPVHWIINASPESRLERVIASGYHPQRVSVTGVSGVAVEVSGDGPRYKDENPQQSAAIWVEEKFKVAPGSVQIARKASDFVVTPKANSSSKS